MLHHAIARRLEYGAGIRYRDGISLAIEIRIVFSVALPLVLTNQRPEVFVRELAEICIRIRMNIGVSMECENNRDDISVMTALPPGSKNSA